MSSHRSLGSGFLIQERLVCRAPGSQNTRNCFSSQALSVLRAELGPLGHRTERVHELAGFLMLNNTPELGRVARWAGPSPEARTRLVESLAELLPASVMLPPRRLQVRLSPMTLDVNKKIRTCTDWFRPFLMPIKLA